MKKAKNTLRNLQYRSGHSRHTYKTNHLQNAPRSNPSRLAAIAMAISVSPLFIANVLYTFDGHCRGVLAHRQHAQSLLSYDLGGGVLI